MQVFDSRGRLLTTKDLLTEARDRLMTMSRRYSDTGFGQPAAYARIAATKSVEAYRVLDCATGEARLLRQINEGGV